MNIITAIREGRLFDANELIREGLNRSMLSAIYSNCPTVMKEAYGGPGAGVISEDEIEYVEECDDMEEDEDEDDEDDEVVEVVEEGFQGVLDKRHDNPSQGKYGTTKTYSRVFSDKSDAQQWVDDRKSQGKAWVTTVSENLSIKEDKAIDLWKKIQNGEESIHFKKKNLQGNVGPAAKKDIEDSIKKIEARLVKLRKQYDDQVKKDREAGLHESIQLDEARDKAGWQAYIGRLNASVVEKQHQIAGARQRVADLRRKKAKPESIAKANEAIAKKQAGLGNLKKRVAEAQKKYQEWLKKEAEKAKKAREKAAKARKTAAKKPTTVKK